MLTKHQTRISDLVSQMSIDETRVIERICERVHKARRKYGSLCIATDKRHWTGELLEEQLDAMTYAAIGALEIEDSEYELLGLEEHDDEAERAP